MHRFIVDTLPQKQIFDEIFAVVMPSYLTFATVEVKIKLPSHFFLVPMAVKNKKTHQNGKILKHAPFIFPLLLND